MGWTEILVAFGSAIVGGVLGWFGHGAWSQRAAGDGSPVVRAGDRSNVTTAGRDINTLYASPKPVARLVIYRIDTGSGVFYLRNDGSADASTASWGIEGDENAVVGVVDSEIGPVSAGADYRLAIDTTSMSSKPAKIWVKWSNPDGSPGQFALPV